MPLAAMTDAQAWAGLRPQQDGLSPATALVWQSGTIESNLPDSGCVFQNKHSPPSNVSCSSAKKKPILKILFLGGEGRLRNTSLKGFGVVCVLFLQIQ